MNTNAAKSKRGLIVPMSLAAIATTAITALTTGAFFTASDAVDGNSFTTGTVDLAATPATAAVTMGNMAPGDVKVGTVNVTNSGSLAQRYAMTSTADNDDTKGLAAALVTTVKTGVTACTEAGFAADGTVVYGPGVFGSTTGTAYFGDVTQGAQAGDRTLAAGAAEDLCVQVVLPATAGNALQDATTTASFGFDAEQVINNP